MTTRRKLLTLGIGGLAALSLAPLNLTRVALAAAPTNRRLVVIILRGAMDGLAAVPPYGDRDYASLRKDIAIAAPDRDGGAMDLNGFFGLHPSLPFLEQQYRSGELAVIHAAATPYRERSHFDGQDVLENGAETAHGADDGWLNRALSLMGRGSGQALAVAQTPPLILRGSESVGSWAPDILPAPQDDFLARLASLYDDDALLGPALREGLRIQDVGDAMMEGEKMSKKASRASSEDLAAMSKPVGRMLADPSGPRIAVFEMTGWDTHFNQGRDNGILSNRFKVLSKGLNELHDAMGAAWKDTAVVVATEFGRTASINGTRGTDHGTGSAAFVLGGGIRGGRVMGRWPGLSKDKLYGGRDLMPTTDLRSLFAAALTGHLGLAGADVASRVFPGAPVAGELSELFQV